MKKITLISLLVIVLSSCNKKYFEFDEIEHFKSQVPESELYDDSKKSHESILQRDILLGNIPASIKDTTFIAGLEQMGFKKNEINSLKFEKINQIFAEKIHFFNESNACIPIYNDILIFKEKSKIVGIAKICFTCRDSQILGTQLNTKNFGQGGDFQKLQNILK